MGGIHVCERTTNDHIYVAAQSQLYIPTTVGNRPNNAAWLNGAFPEFIHGFYIDGYGFDIGLIYDSGWILQFYALPTTYADKRTVRVGSFDVPWTLMLRTYFEGGQLIAQCTDENGHAISPILKASLANDAYQRLTSGCTINREMLLAMNPDQSEGKHFNLPAEAYYSQAKFTNTTLTTASGSYVFMTSSNSNAVYNKVDTGMTHVADYYLSYARTVTEFGKYVADVTTATFDKARHPISDIS